MSFGTFFSFYLMIMGLYWLISESIKDNGYVETEFDNGKDNKRFPENLGLQFIFSLAWPFTFFYHVYIILKLMNYNKTKFVNKSKFEKSLPDSFKGKVVETWDFDQGHDFKKDMEDVNNESR